MTTQPNGAPRPDDNALGRGVQVTTRGGVQVITSPDGRSTTVTDRGRVTTVTTLPDGRVAVSVNGRAVVDARALNDAITRVATTGQDGREPGIRVNGRALDGNELLAGGVLLGVAGGVIVTLVLTVVARTLSRLGRRASASSRHAPDVSPRLERIEEAVETIALEVERVAEAQRYSARLLTDRLPDPAARVPAAGRAEARVLTPH